MDPPITLQGKPSSSQGLVTADSYILWYYVCAAAQHTERISRLTHPVTKFISLLWKPQNLQPSVCFNRSLVPGMWLHMHGQWRICGIPAVNWNVTVPVYVTWAVWPADCMGRATSRPHGPYEQQTAWAVWPADHIFIFYTIRTWNLNLPLHITLRLHNHNCFIFSN